MMKIQAISKPSRLLVALLGVAVISTPLVAYPSTVTQTASSTGTTSAWGEAIWGSPATVASGSNAYVAATGLFSANDTRLGVSVTGRVRSYGGIFAGRSLEIPASTELLLKDILVTGTQSANLILDSGGTLRLSPNVAGAYLLDGTITLAGSCILGVVHANPTTLTLNSTITGASTLKIRAGDGSSNTIVFAGDLSGLTGTIDIGGGNTPVTVGFDQDYNLPETELLMGGHTTADRLDLSHHLTFKSFKFAGNPLAPGTYTAANLNALFSGTSTRFIANGGSLTLLQSDTNAAASAKVFIIGDSTVNNSLPQVGWGQMIFNFFKSGVSFVNNANPGESSKSFITENRWANTISQVSANDYVLIQFGHNDSHYPTNSEATSPDPDPDSSGTSVNYYRNNLNRYITETRAKGAIPVLVTPMHRRYFVNGILQSYYPDSAHPGYNMDLAPYAAAMKQVAQANNVQCVDLFASSGVYMQLLGDARCSTLQVDATHWKKTGAIAIADLVAKGLSEVLPTQETPPNDRELTRYLRTGLLLQLYRDLMAGKIPGPILALDKDDTNLRLDWFLQPGESILQKSTNLVTWTAYAAGAGGSVVAVPLVDKAFFRVSQP